MTLLSLTLNKNAMIEEAIAFRNFLVAHPEFITPGTEEPTQAEMDRINAAFELYLDGRL